MIMYLASFLLSVGVTKLLPLYSDALCNVLSTLGLVVVLYIAQTQGMLVALDILTAGMITSAVMLTINYIRGSDYGEE